ncbi:MAG: MBL fold metallo-hydrolase [Sphaerochaeta sp.]|nr:MBL fold metallo-hydrolase [Sphaerochaeta sp.]
MYELVQVGEKSYYIQSPAKIGVYVPDGQNAVLIDSGNDKDAGRKVRQILERQNWRLTAIVNTHSNADHIGGNKYLQAQTGCKVFANGIEADFTRHPLLEPSFLYGGYPCKALRHKFIMAQESDALDFSHPDFPRDLDVIPLPGHFFDMVGFRTPDDTVFLADCLSSEATLDKYGIPFIYDVQAYLDTLIMVESMEARMFVPAHAEASPNVAALARLNHERTLVAAEHILTLCKTPTNFEEILRGIFYLYHLTMSIEQYVLVGSTVRSFLAWLGDAGKLTAAFTDNRMVWERV